MNRRRIDAHPRLPLEEFGAEDDVHWSTIAVDGQPDPEQLVAHNQSWNVLNGCVRVCFGQWPSHGFFSWFGPAGTVRFLLRSTLNHTELVQQETRSLNPSGERVVLCLLGHVHGLDE